jgi:Na+/H+-dicarboxylate symporter
MTPEEVRIEHIKAVYYARKVILQYGTPSEKIATNRAMKKMEIKLGVRKSKRGRRKK